MWVLQFNPYKWPKINGQVGLWHQQQGVIYSSIKWFLSPPCNHFCIFHWQAYYLSLPGPTRAWYCVSCACKGVATTPVPMAQTGSLGFRRWLLKSNQKERNRTSWWFSHPFEQYYILRKIIFPTTFKRDMLTSLEGTQIGSSPQVGEFVQPPPREWTQLGLHLVKQDLKHEKTSRKMTTYSSLFSTRLLNSRPAFWPWKYVLQQRCAISSQEESTNW